MSKIYGKPVCIPSILFMHSTLKLNLHAQTFYKSDHILLLSRYSNRAVTTVTIDNFCEGIMTILFITIKQV